MPQGFLTRVMLICVSVFAAAGFWSCADLTAEAATNVLGYLDARGTFRSVCRLTQDGSSVTLEKIRSSDSFDDVRIRFIFPHARRPGGMKGLLVQWEKASGRMGKLVSLQDHRWFDKRSGTLRAQWKRSKTFRLVDKSGRNIFRTLPWNKILVITVSGKTLSQRPEATATLKHAPASGLIGGPSGSLHISSVDNGARLGGEKASKPAEEPQGVVAVQRRLESAQRRLEERIEALESRLGKIDRSVAVSSRWFYWGPLLVLGLSILFTCVTVFLTFSRLSLRRGGKNRSVSRPTRTKF